MNVPISETLQFQQSFDELNKPRLIDVSGGWGQPQCTH